MRQRSEAEIRYRTLFEQAPDGILIIGTDGAILDFNEAAHRQLGFSREEFAGLKISDIDPLESNEEIQARIRRLLHREKAEFEVTLRTKEGAARDVHVIAQAFALSGRTLFHTIWRDITDRRKAENALREALVRVAEESARTDAIIEAVGDGISIQDTNFTVLYQNRVHKNLLGEHTGEHCYRAYQCRESICEGCYLAMSLKDGKVHQGERLRITVEGKRYYDVVASPLRDSTGRIIAAIEAVREITARKQMEEELRRHREQLEDLVEERTKEILHAAQLASIGQLAAGVAHEINNPINGIINYAQILTDTLPAFSKERDIATRIIKEGKRVATIVHSLLSFGRKQKGEKIPVGIENILFEALILTEAQIRKEGICLKIHMSEGLPRVEAHPQQLQQVFLNVLTNAQYALNQKYPKAQKDKILEIHGEKVIVNDDSRVRISFLDYGTGIPSQMLGKVANPFFSTKPSGQGTGLGLSICHEIVKAHGGSLTVESEEGKFTRVMIDIPVAKSDGK
jgi:PAS domain S-box-containing protein